MLEQLPLATDSRFNSNARRNEHRDALKGIIRHAFSSMTSAQVASKLDQAQIANARMNSMADLWEHLQRKACDRWRQVETPVGNILALLPPGRISSFDYRMEAVPDVGEHTQAILRELGRGDSDIAAMQQAGAI